jgi:hypothetical protein
VSRFQIRTLLISYFLIFCLRSNFQKSILRQNFENICLILLLNEHKHPSLFPCSFLMFSFYSLLLVSLSILFYLFLLLFVTLLLSSIPSQRPINVLSSTFQTLLVVVFVFICFHSTHITNIFTPDYLSF